MSLSDVKSWKPGTVGITKQEWIVLRLHDGALVLKGAKSQAWSEGELGTLGLEGTVIPDKECRITFATFDQKTS